MVPRIVIIIFMFVLSGCAGVEKNQYKTWSATPTPELWHKSPVWNFVLLDNKEEIIETLIVEFTEDFAETCSSGSAKKLKILKQKSNQNIIFNGHPSYYLKGSALAIDLISDCDSGYELSGKVSEIGVEGTHQPVTMYGGKIVGRFYGFPAIK